MATIQGKEREVAGFDAQGNLVLTDGELFLVTPLEMDPGTFRSLRLVSISALHYSGGRWCLDGEPLENSWQRHAGSLSNPKERDFVFAIWSLCRRLGVSYPGSGPIHPIAAEMRERVVAVAVCQERFDEYPKQEENLSKRYKYRMAEKTVEMLQPAIPASQVPKPVFLSAFSRIHQPTAAPLKAADEYVVGREAAASYANVSVKTISNWKKDGWLIYKQAGKKVRFSKSDLDKCKARTS